MFAYPNVRLSPVSYLLDPTRREPVAIALNAAILDFQKLASCPGLENIVRQTAVCLRGLRLKDTVSATRFLTVDPYLEKLKNITESLNK